ncbi:putative U box domain, armadillo-like helical, Zinc finger, RING/FYVE/PHD-type [Helianthus annuus]|nr:putative U box domain, armadillo-like helical, Zinc finger, RING/FYVE/PHD-type [Helianthus annuus]KAJ0720669.1 putative U box domain, armadillo-like helical, Zinc finger, RING/FYVE/PHD-type [Helianthus annuus]KAJ0723853.1 putative U box domain, armadillo-like helical, Zinc finger, RING/FYVE/PHD-type [Helianthus annuus]
MADVGKIGVILKLIDIVNEISVISDYRSTVRKQFFNLSRRLKLLNPLFEEIRDVKEAVPDESFRSLVSLMEALESAKELLRLGSEGSKIYLGFGFVSVDLGEIDAVVDCALEKEEIMKKYQEVTERLEKDLEGISFEKLDISDEVKEQVALVLAQFRRAKGRTDAPDVELNEDLSSLYDKGSDVAADPSVLKRLIEKLQLTRINDLTHESITLHEMVTASDGDPGENIEKMSMLLKLIKDFVQTDNPSADSPPGETSAPPNSNNQETSSKSYKNILIPDDFRCPISLELMKDPVIVSTGQTYERTCIEKWLEAGHKTCPKTQQNLTSTVLIPNYVLRSLIAQWCEANGIDPPQRAGRPTSACTPAERSLINVLLTKLKSVSPDDQRTAAGEIRLLAKRNADNRVAIAEAGAIPLLTHLLTAPDSRTQEHAVTALLNLSICEDNKGSIVSSGAVPGIVQVLKKGSMEARESEE